MKSHYKQKIFQITSSFLKTLKHYGKLIWQFLKIVLPVLLGQVRWTPPLWWERVKDSAKKARDNRRLWWRNNVLPWCRANQKLLRLSSLIGILVLVSSIGFYVWWERQPKPLEADFEIAAPTVMPLQENAKPSSLFLRFNRSVAPLGEVKKPVTRGILLSPAVNGSWKWNSDRELEFKPEADWPINQRFNVKIEKNYLPSHVALEIYSKNFYSPKFEVSAVNWEFNQHPENPKEKRAVMTLKFSHPVDPESLKKKIKIVLTGNKEVLGNIPTSYESSVEYDKFFSKAFIKSDLIPIPLKDTKAVITVEKGLISSRGGNYNDNRVEQEVTVPGMYTHFQISEIDFQFVENQKYELEQVLAVDLTTEVLAEELEKNISVYLLPASRPDANGKMQKLTTWAVGEVTPEVLKSSEKIKLVATPLERPQSRLHTFRIQVPPTRHLFVRLNKGINSYHGYVLATEHTATVATKEFPQEIKIMGEGGLLALSGSRKLSLLSRGVATAKIQVAHVLPDQLNHMIALTSGDFTNPQFNYSYAFNWDNITEKSEEILELGSTGTGKPTFAAFDAGKYLAKSSSGVGRGLLYLSISPYDRKTKSTYGNAETRFLLLSDLGVIAKKTADNGYDVFVQSIHSGSAVAGATVQVIGKNSLPALTATTDANGRVTFSDFTNLKNEKEPLAFVVQQGRDLSFLPLRRADRTLDFSRYDVGGVRTSGKTSNLLAYLFTERGLYRPGDKYRVAGIVRSMNWKTKLKGIPVEWVITDPKGQEILKQQTSLREDGFLEIENQTLDTSFVGNYTANLYIVKDEKRDAHLGSTVFRVEEFQPDRLRISSGFLGARGTGWISPENLKTWVRVMNLFGFPAEGNRVTADLALRPATPYFPAYSDYRFFSPIKNEKSFSETLTEQTTNEKGEVEFNLDISKFEKGNYHVAFAADAFEKEGGRSVSTETSVMVSPFPYFVGYKTESDLSYLKLDSTHQIEYISINPELKKVKTEGLKLELVQVEYVSVLMKQGNGTYRYESVRREKSLSSQNFSIAATGTQWSVPTKDAGDYRVLIKDPGGNDVSKVDFTVVGQSNIMGKMDRNAELQLKLSRNSVEHGEDLEMQIRAPYIGAGLITIERDKVYASKWFRTSTTNSIQSIRIPEGLEGNAYVTVTFLRSPTSREIFMSPLSSAVAPFSVALKRRTLKVNLGVASESKPGSKLTITHSTSKKSRIAVFAVDEGILQVAGYKTPDPLKVFFEKKALEVSTSQLLDLVLPEFDLLRELSAPGGDGSGESLGRNLNPFKRKNKAPAVFWSGIIESGPTASTLQYTIPDYFNGTLRVMAVAVAEDAIGIAESKSVVTGDFVITPAVPVVLTPGDEVSVGVAVFNNVKGSGENAKVQLSLETVNGIEIVGSKTLQLEINETKEKTASFQIRAKDELGVGRLRFVAAGGSKTVRLEEEISLRPATPYRTQIQTGSLTSGSANLDIQRNIYPHFAQREVTVSLLPLSLAHGLLNFLKSFPYACTEQIVSGGLPQILLSDKPDFKIAPKEREVAHQKVLAALRQRQTGVGAFGLYSPYSAAQDFPSLYAAQYLIEARARGLAVPNDLFERTKDYLLTLSQKSVNDITEARLTAYSLYLLTRAGVTVGNQMMTLNKEIKSLKLDDFKKDIGSAFLAAAYRLMKQDDAAQSAIAGVEVQRDYRFDAYYDNHIHNAFYAYLIAKYFPEKIAKVKTRVVESMVHMIQNTQYNTLNAALSVLALEAMSSSAGGDIRSVVQVSQADGKGASQALVLPEGLFPRGGLSPSTRKVTFQGQGDATKYYQTTVAGFDRLEGLPEIKQKLEVLREYRKGTSVVSKAQLGDELEVHLHIRSTDGASRSNIAIVDLLPSGFEIVQETSYMSSYWDLRLKNPAKMYSFWKTGIFFESAQAQEDESDEESEGGYEAVEVSESETESNETLEQPSFALEGSNFSSDFVEPREDRVVIYGSVGPDITKFIYRIRATNKGKFRVPPAFAEDLYDRSTQYLGSAGEFIVE